jgi:hypothetical protein
MPNPYFYLLVENYYGEQYSLIPLENFFLKYSNKYFFKLCGWCQNAFFNKHWKDFLNEKFVIVILKSRFAWQDNFSINGCWFRKCAKMEITPIETFINWDWKRLVQFNGSWAGFYESTFWPYLDYGEKYGQILSLKNYGRRFILKLQANFYMPIMY